MKVFTILDKGGLTPGLIISDQETYSFTLENGETHTFYKVTLGAGGSHVLIDKSVTRKKGDDLFISEVDFVFNDEICHNVPIFSSPFYDEKPFPVGDLEDVMKEDYCVVFILKKGILTDIDVDSISREKVRHKVFSGIILQSEEGEALEECCSVILLPKNKSFRVCSNDPEFKRHYHFNGIWMFDIT